MTAQLRAFTTAQLLTATAARARATGCVISATFFTAGTVAAATTFTLRSSQLRLASFHSESSDGLFDFLHEFRLFRWCFLLVCVVVVVVIIVSAAAVVGQCRHDR